MRYLFCLFIFINALSSTEKPNILFISIDDLNDWVGYLNAHPQAKTPNMDRLVKRSIAFTNAHCSTPLCKPSRTAFLTGLREDKTKVYSNKSKFDPSEYTLLPQYFSKYGYKTYGTGKIHHSKNNSKFFDESLSIEQRWSPFNGKDVLYTKAELPSKGSDHPAHLIKNGPGQRDYTLPLNKMPSERAPNQTSGESFDWASFELEDEAFGDGLITKWAIDQLKEHNPNKPFFMGIGYYRPHIPLYAPKKYFDLYPLESIQLPKTKKNDLDDIPQAGKDRALIPMTAGSHQHVKKHGEWKKAVQAYLACVSFIDAQIGKVLDFLDHSPYAKNTVIVVFSDHGWHLGEKQAWGKFTGWVHSTRVPFIMSGPQLAQGELCHETISLLDIFPTLIDLAGLPKTELDGISIKPLLLNPKTSTKRIVKTQLGEHNYSLISKEWHYIHYHDGSEELYDRTSDPLEFKNLASKEQYKSVIRMMKESQL